MYITHSHSLSEDLEGPGGPAGCVSLAVLLAEIINLRSADILGFPAERSLRAPQAQGKNLLLLQRVSTQGSTFKESCQTVGNWVYILVTFMSLATSYSAVPASTTISKYEKWQTLQCKLIFPYLYFWDIFPNCLNQAQILTKRSVKCTFYVSCTTLPSPLIITRVRWAEQW